MKLTNRQLDLVVTMIYNNINTTEAEQKRKLEKEKHINQVMKKFIKSNLYKIIAGYLNSSLFQSYCKGIDVFNKNIAEELGLDSSRWHTTSYTTFNTVQDFYDKCIERVSDNYKDPNPGPSKKDIENKVILSMINAKDLSALVECITSSFKK